MDHGQEPAKIKKLNKKQENNAMSQHAVDEIILQENNKLSAQYETHDNIDSKTNKDNLYDIDIMNLDENREKKEFRTIIYK